MPLIFAFGLNLIYNTKLSFSAWQYGFHPNALHIFKERNSLHSGHSVPHSHTTMTLYIKETFRRKIPHLARKDVKQNTDRISVKFRCSSVKIYKQSSWSTFPFFPSHQFSLLCFSKVRPLGEPEEIVEFSTQYAVLHLSLVSNDLREVFNCKQLLLVSGWE